MNSGRIQSVLASVWAASVLVGQAANLTLSSRPAPPAPPVREAPTKLFRELLAANPAERERHLASRTPAARQLIESKLREFEILPPEHRELRLHVAELQYFLSPLLRAEPGGRTEALAQAPTEIRPLLEERLQNWDTLSLDQRRELLDSEKSLSWFVRLQTTQPRAMTNLLAQLPPDKRAELESQFGRWRALSPEERARKTADFQRFFDLSEKEQEKVLGVITPRERQEMDATLIQFAQLPPAQRERAVRGFRRFLALTAPERAEFLQSIARWQLMTPMERATWRDMVAQVTAPPPMPPEPVRRRHNLVTTNGP